MELLHELLQGDSYMTVRFSVVVGLVIVVIVGLFLWPVRLAGRRSIERSGRSPRAAAERQPLLLAEAANAPARDHRPSLPALIRLTNREAARGLEGATLDLFVWRIYLNMEWQQRSDFERLCPALHAAQVSLWQDDLLLEEGLLIPQLIGTDGLPQTGERHQLHVVEYPTLSQQEFGNATRVVVYFETDRKWSYGFSLGPVKDGKRTLSAKWEGLNPLRTIFRDPRQLLTAKVALREIIDEEAQVKERPRPVRRRRPRQLAKVEQPRAARTDEVATPVPPPAPPQ